MRRIWPRHLVREVFHYVPLRKELLNLLRIRQLQGLQE
jgi:hypothetical protein